MMHKKKLVAVLGLCILSFVSCGTKIEDAAEIQKEAYAQMTYYDEDVLYVEDHIIDGRFDIEQPVNYAKELVESHMEIFSKEKTLIKCATAIDYVNRELYVLDNKKNEIAVLDKEGNRLGSYGKLGSGPCEFSTPVDFFYQESMEEWYVLDSGNHRIQILDKNLGFKREVSLKSIDLETEDYQSIAVDEEQNIYISLNSASWPSKNRLFRLNKQGEIYWYPGLFSGELFVSNQKVYCYDSYQVYLYRDEVLAPTDHYVSNGPNRLYQVTADKREPIGDLPYGYTPTCVVFQGERVYSYSDSWNRVDVFLKKEGILEHEYSLTKQFDTTEIKDWFHGDFVLVEQDIYLAMKDGMIYRLKL